MYRVTYPKLLEILKQAECEIALEGLKNITEDIVDTAEIDFEVYNKDTEDEITHINEFNVYTKTSMVIFGVLTKNGDDFTIEWARTKPCPNYTRLR